MTDDDMPTIRKLSPLILALDTPDLEEGRGVANRVRDHVDIVKVGMELFFSAGPEAVSALKKDGFEVFLDLKLHDIPNTVSSAINALCALEPLMLTVHTTGGQEMMWAAAASVKEHCEKAALRRPLLMGVTVLTSIDLTALHMIGFHGSIEEHVLGLAKLAAQSDLDGLVTSPLETRPVRREVGAHMILATPGIRLQSMAHDDQMRVATPGEAIRSGADFLVVGRPLRHARDPEAAAREILGDAGRP